MPSLPAGLRLKILRRYNFICVYCGGDAHTVDHIIPYSYQPNNKPDNLVAACIDCNLIAGDHVFDSFEEKAEFVRRIRKNPKWRRRYRKRVSICVDCKTAFKPRSNGATIFLCSRCAQLADCMPEEGKITL